MPLSGLALPFPQNTSTPLLYKYFNLSRRVNFACPCRLHLRQCLRQVSVKLIGPFSPPCLSFTLIAESREEKHRVSTFPPPRVDITSKTWPSFADMLLRRWREGEHLGRVFFCAPLSHLGLAGGNGRETPHRRRCNPLSVQRCGGLSATFRVRRCL